MLANQIESDRKRRQKEKKNLKHLLCKQKKNEKRKKKHPRKTKNHEIEKKE